MFGKNKKAIKKHKTSAKEAMKGLGEFYKNGIRRIDSDSEMLEAFGVDEAEDEDEKEQAESTPSKRKKNNPIRKKSENTKLLDKNGIPVFENSVDFSKEMNIEPDSEKMLVDEKPEKAETAKIKQEKKTRHGIQILGNDDDYLTMFGENESEGEFSEKLAESLGEKSMSALLKEKCDKKGGRKKISVKERLKRYPLPQGQLDLHGYTAVKADLKAEAYIKNAFHNGTYTVRIIVGKGLHSEDGPVLPDVIEKRILQMKNEKIIYAYEWDKKKKTKSGSVTVFLNNYHI